jgi:ribonuclease HII
MLRNFARETGMKLVVGVDEVGWGAFAGPIVTAAVAFPPEFESELIVDSKLICKSKNKMQAAYDVIMENALHVSCTAVSAKVINKIEPMPALTQCLHDSIRGIEGDIDMLLIDGDKYTPYDKTPYKLVPKGDNTFLSIAAAAIVAKYRRDEYMTKVHEIHPHYGFNSSKGYGSPKMYAGLLEHGRCSYHRDKYVNTWEKNKKKKLNK